MIDVGAARLIMRGEVAVANQALAEFTATGVRYADGSEAAFDAVVFATGERSREDVPQKQALGDARARA